MSSSRPLAELRQLLPVAAATHALACARAATMHRILLALLTSPAAALSLPSSLAGTPAAVPALVAQIAAGARPLDVLPSLFPFPLDEFQMDALRALDSDRSVVVSAPTGSGKTVIGELAVYMAMALGQRVVYTTPLKALSNQKFGDFQRQFGRERVGLLTGDTSINRDADVLLMTTEVFRNMLLQPESDNPLARVSAVVLDEFHYMNDPGRGTVWEESCILCPPTTRIIALSATMANADSIASWLTKIHGPTELIASSFRPVPLRYLFADNLGLEPLFVAGDAGPGGRPDEPQSPKKRRQKWKLNPRLRPEQRLMREAEAAARGGRPRGRGGDGGRGGRGRGGRGRGRRAHARRGRRRRRGRADGRRARRPQPRA